MKQLVTILSLVSLFSTAYAAEPLQPSIPSDSHKIVCESTVYHHNLVSLHDLSKGDEFLLLDNGKYALTLSGSRVNAKQTVVRLYSLTALWGLKNQKKLIAKSTSNADLLFATRADSNTYFTARCQNKADYKAKMLQEACDEKGYSKLGDPASSLHCQHLRRIGLFD